MEKNKNPLTFLEYYEKYRTPHTLFAANCGVSFYNIYNLYRGGCPSLKTAIAIEKYTEGELTCFSLLPKERHQEIEEAKNKNQQ